MVRGYIDESYEGVRVPEIFTLSCSLACGGDWAFIEVAWLWIVGKKNKSLLEQGRKPIDRYHAVYCFNRKKDFDGWSRSERDSFVSELFSVFEMFPTAHVALSISAKDIAEVWPENQEQPLHFAYNILIQVMMIEIGRNGIRLSLNEKISLIYERSDYGESLLRGFNKMKDDPTFRYQDRYTTLAPMGWEDCAPLQIADLVAYELFRDMKRRKKGRAMNLSLAALVSKDNFKLISKHLEKQHLTDLRERHDAAILRISTKESAV